MHYWVVSDTHFNHTRLEQWGRRSGDWQEQLWKGLGSIPWEDTLIHLGDVCVGNDEAINRRLLSTPARNKVLVLGNHDRRATELYASMGWSFVCDGIDLRALGHCLRLTHRPEPETGHFTRNIHGHTHDNQHRSEEYASYYNAEYHTDISPELVGFRPLRLDALAEGLGPVGAVPRRPPRETRPGSSLGTERRR